MMARTGMEMVEKVAFIHPKIFLIILVNNTQSINGSSRIIFK
jgi:hypothetical protein